jgi:hypothetical protein
MEEPAEVSFPSFSFSVGPRSLISLLALYRNVHRQVSYSTMLKLNKAS